MLGSGNYATDSRRRTSYTVNPAPPAPRPISASWYLIQFFPARYAKYAAVACLVRAAVWSAPLSHPP
jgi:hypothetical protein